MSVSGRPRGAQAVERFMRPRSAAIVGISSKPGTAGQVVLENLLVNEFKGDIHLVGRSGGEIAGRPVAQDFRSLPAGIDLAVLTLPANAVVHAVKECIEREVGAAVIFASGFSEIGNAEAQDEISELASVGNIALLGPNCFGYSNFVDGLVCGFSGVTRAQRIKPLGDPAVGIVAQSGGLMEYMRLGLQARQLQVSYTVSTGNEADLGLADFIDFLIADTHTNVIAVYAEDVRKAGDFLAAAKRAKAASKPIVMLHSGRSAGARAATQSHTGALMGDYAAMAVTLRQSAVLLVDTLEELNDVVEIMARFPKAAPNGGIGVVTFSGAFCAIAHDYCDKLGLELPPLSQATGAEINAQLSDLTRASNPLDLGALVIARPELITISSESMLRDPAIGSVVIAITAAGPSLAPKLVDAVVAAVAQSRGLELGGSKPIVYCRLADMSPVPAELMKRISDNGVVLSHSPERSLRALAHVHAYGRSLAQPAAAAPRPIEGITTVASGTLPEYVGKTILSSAGIGVPAGGLAKSIDDAVEIAGKIGYPVALKAQAAALAHKTEAGAVELNLAGETALREAWNSMSSRIAKRSGVALDGMLVEKMSRRGVELMIGAKRDLKWGPILLVGLGGIWVEALGDVRLMPPDLPPQEIAVEIRKLKSAKVFGEFRGAPERDVEAVARALSIVGRLMLTMPHINEIDINPLMMHAAGEGVTALDALFVIN